MSDEARKVPRRRKVATVAADGPSADPRDATIDELTQALREARAKVAEAEALAQRVDELERCVAKLR